MAKTLIAGPWVGEFGWEIMCWQGYLRKLASKYDEVIVSSRPGREALYQDFADTYLPHELTGDRDCWMLHGDGRGKQILEQSIIDMMKKLDADRIFPQGPVALNQQEFITYGDASKVREGDRYDVLFHFRLRHDRGSERNTPGSLAKEIRDRLPPGMKIACIGSKEEAACYPGYADRRGIPLEQLLDLIAASYIVSGPASAPCLLASLCKTPHISWSTKRWYSAVKMDNMKRMKEGWNPFRVPCEVLDRWGFQPPAIEAAGAVKGAIEWARDYKRRIWKEQGVSGADAS